MDSADDQINTDSFRCGGAGRAFRAFADAQEGVGSRTGEAPISRGFLAKSMLP